MANDPEFRQDLYRGTAMDYETFRVPYPPALLGDLRGRAHVTGGGNLLDLACGTGQITFALCQDFGEVWAVDQEAESIVLAREKAERQGVRNVRWITGRAEEVVADGYFELVAVGNAFHRLRRGVVADNAIRWLTPLGHFALLWCNTPWEGEAEWQRVVAETIARWMRKAGATDRVPRDLNEALAREPNSAILERAGFSLLGTYRFPTPHVWTVGRLVGFIYSTSFLSRQALGEHAEAFRIDLREQLLDCDPEGVFHETIAFSYDLARRRDQTR